MKLVLVTHPPELGSASMPRFANMIRQGMAEREYDVSLLSSPSLAGRFLRLQGGVRKWTGYVDQFMIYPQLLSQHVKAFPADTLFVFSDHALGPWVPRVAHRPHVIHCHDFLAQRSALGEVPENPTRWTGRQYQRLIRRGYRKGKHFISVSHRSQEDLHRFLGRVPETSEVVHNGLNGDFRVLKTGEAQSTLKNHVRDQDRDGFLLHVGGNQWYKHRAGVIELYSEWCRVANRVIPLWMIGTPPTDTLKFLASEVPNGGQVRFLLGLSDEEVRAAYNLASLFLFPSLEEGFGWPIAEAMACGTLVLTTNAAPMTEVGGSAALYHRRKLQDDATWARDGAEQIESCLKMPKDEKGLLIERSIRQASQFDTARTLDRYESIYRHVLNDY